MTEITKSITYLKEYRELKYALEKGKTPALAVGLSAIHKAHLAAALEGNDLPPGDFVRHCRQVIDLLDQLTADEELGGVAREAIRAVRRGLVAQEIDR